MKLHLYQILVSAIALIMIIQGVKNYFHGKSSQTILKLLVRIIVWGGMASIAVYPNASIILARIIGLEGNINAVILTGFLLIFLMIFKLLSAIERLEQQMTAVTRKESLKEITQIK